MPFWTKLHLMTILPTFLILILISLFLRKHLIKKPYETRMIPIKIIAVLLVVFEIAKQICSFVVGYDLFHIPLHFCSIFVYVLPLFAFYRAKGKENVRSISCAAMTSLLLGMLVMPGIIYSGERIETFFVDFFSFHTVFFHNLVIFALFLTFALDLHQSSGKRNETLFVIAFGAVFVAISATASHLLQTNFSNFLSSTVDFVAQMTCDLKLAIGNVMGTLIYVFVLVILHILLLVLTNYIFYLLCKVKKATLSDT